MKTEKLILGDNTIETPSLTIKKNIMTWENTMIQLSNISSISSGNMELIRFPVLVSSSFASSRKDRGAILSNGAQPQGEILRPLSAALIIPHGLWINK